MLFLFGSFVYSFIIIFFSFAFFSVRHSPHPNRLESVSVECVAKLRGNKFFAITFCCVSACNDSLPWISWMVILFASHVSVSLCISIGAIKKKNPNSHNLNFYGTSLDDGLLKKTKKKRLWIRRKKINGSSGIYAHSYSHIHTQSHTHVPEAGCVVWQCVESIF